MNIKTKRYSELDLYKGIGIIATVTAASGMLSKVLQYRFDAVCFPLFMMAAGALWHKRGFETDEKEAVRQGFKKTMMPFFWFTLIYLLIDSVGMFVSPLYTLKATYSDLWDSVSFVGISVLWFLPAYFIGVTAYRVFRHNFRLVIICIILTAVAFSLTGILFYKGYSGMYDAGDVEVCLQSYGLRIALLFWRSSVGMFFCAFGEVFCLIGEKLSEKKLIVVVLSVLFTGAGVGLSFLIARCNYTVMVLDKPYVTLPVSLCLGGGLMLFCSWIGTIKPIDFLGRHAIIIYLTFSDFGILKTALKLGQDVFVKTDNNFANRATVAAAVIVMELILICIFRLKIFSFLLGERDFSVPEAEEDVL
ncbi:MAG: hypothetical protein IKR23_12410 [Lachnospiraceae bacterium]|nr:hypothetical protein [Lachnospiraceae bacterium]